MKKFLLLIIGTLCFQFLNAQFLIGPHGGVDINNVRLNGVPDIIAGESKSYVSANLGIHGEYLFSDAISISTELNYRQKGFTLNQSNDFNFLGIEVPIGVKAETKLQYIDVPVFLKYRLNKENVSFYAEAGPSIAYGMAGEIDLKASALIDLNLPSEKINFNNDGYKRLNYAANLGLGAETNISETIRGYAVMRYSYSLNNILNDPIIGIDARANAIHFGIGVSSSIGKKQQKTSKRRRK